MSRKCVVEGFSSRVLVRVGFALFLLSLSVRPIFAISCGVVHHPAPTDADTAFLSADFAKSAQLYQAALAINPGDANATIGLVHSLLRQLKIQEAADALQAAVKPGAESAALMTLRGEVELRQGDPWKASATAVASQNLDPCNPRTMLLLSRLSDLNSQYAMGRKLLLSAHMLDSEDPEIRAAWMRTLPTEKRIPEMEAYLAAPRGDTADVLRDLHTDLDEFKSWTGEPRKSCTMVSQVPDAEIPLAAVRNSGAHTMAFGLDLKVNNHKLLAGIDTGYNSRFQMVGASGILIRESIAQQFGLKTLVQNQVPGGGNEGLRPGYLAYAASISIGNIEFRDCAVQVMDATHFTDGADGLIGMDILSDYLVTLDYPAEKLILSPLPPRPATAVAQDGLYNRYIAPEMNDYTPIFRTGGSDLIVPTLVNGKRPMLFVVATGVIPSVLSPGAAFEVVKGHKDPKYEVRDYKERVINNYSAGDVTLNFAKMSWSEVHIPSFDTSRFSDDAGMEISGLIGLRMLNHMTVHIDYRDGLMKFDYDPSKRTSLALPY